MNFERFTSGGAFIYSRKCQTLVSRPAKPGVYLNAIRGYKIHFALFSKSGFTANLIKKAQKEHVLLFQGAEFEQVNYYKP